MREHGGGADPTRPRPRRWRRATAAAVLVAAVVAGLGGPAPGDGHGLAGRPAAAATADRPSPTMRELATARGLRFGTAVADAAVLSDTDHASVLASEFTTVVSENHMKWSLIHPGQATFAFDVADAQVAFAEANGMDVRGHTLAWWNQNPDWLTSGTWTPTEGRSLLEGHIDAVAGRYAGRIAQWDVVNEAITGTGGGRPYLWSDLLGHPDHLDIAFRRARQADPAAALYYNDFGIERPGPKFDGVLALVDGMQARGVPIDGVGFQSHLSLQTCTARCTNDFLTNMLALDRRGLEVAVTELDVAVPLPATPGALDQQATVYRSLLAACLLAPNCDTFMLWGISDAHSWIPTARPGFGAALPLDEGFRAKPAWHAMHQLLADPPTAPSCADHATQPAAQATLRAGGEGAPLLDPDGDGVACPALPASVAPPTSEPTVEPTTTPTATAGGMAPTARAVAASPTFAG